MTEIVASPEAIDFRSDDRDVCPVPHRAMAEAVK